MTGGIPQKWLYLPLVDQARGVTIKDKRRIDPHGDFHAGVNVDSNFTLCRLTSRFRLPASFGALNKDSAGTRKRVRKDFIRDTVQIINH